MPPADRPTLEECEAAILRWEDPMSAGAVATECLETIAARIRAARQAEEPPGPAALWRAVSKAGRTTGPGCCVGISFISVEAREEFDRLMSAAIAARGALPEPVEDARLDVGRLLADSVDLFRSLENGGAYMRSEVASLRTRLIDIRDGERSAEEGG